MIDLEKYLLEQINRHPSMQPQDVVKLCYQAVFGAEHLLQAKEWEKRYLQEEYDRITAKDVLLYEEISAEICRVNLAAWKYHGLPAEWLFPMLAASPFQKKKREKLFCNCLKEAEDVLKQASIEFFMEDWNKYLAEYQKEELRPVHHSPQYREKEEPAYRIADRKYIRLFPVLKSIAKVLQEKQRCIVAIDGRAASGKTTMANQLQEIFGADVIRMDDFFLPLELRTEERFAAPGGNVHYERFAEEVLPYIASKEPFSYRIFDCSRMAYHGRREIGVGKVRIVEGSYSCHPQLGKYADMTVFSDVDGEEQMKRIVQRNGETMAEMFRSRWIPMEEAYFREYDISKRADFQLK